MSLHRGMALSAPLGRARCGAADLEGATQPKHLAAAEAHERAGSLDREAPVHKVDQRAKPRQFSIARLDHRHRASPRADDSMPQ